MCNPKTFKAEAQWCRSRSSRHFVSVARSLLKDSLKSLPSCIQKLYPLSESVQLNCFSLRREDILCKMEGVVGAYKGLCALGVLAIRNNWVGVLVAGGIIGYMNAKSQMWEWG